MRGEFSTKLTGTHSSIVLGALALSLLSIAPSCALRSLYVTSQGADYSAGSSFTFPWHTYPTNQFVEKISVPLSSSFIFCKATQSSPRPLLTHDAPVSPSPRRPALGLISKCSSQSFKVGLSCFLLEE